jgi:hypothetical protein
MLRHRQTAERISRKVSAKRKGERINDLRILGKVHKKYSLALHIERTIKQLMLK